MSDVFQTGAVAPESGIYEVIGEGGAVLGRLPLEEGESFPPFRDKTANFRFIRSVHAKYTTIASAAAMEETTAEFDRALRSLANK